MVEEQLLLQLHHRMTEPSYIVRSSRIGTTISTKKSNVNGLKIRCDFLVIHHSQFFSSPFLRY